jgi:proliferating cell nuclear antigen
MEVEQSFQNLSLAEDALFTIQFTKASYFKKYIDALKDLLGAVTIKCNEHGMSMQSMDSAHVALCYLFINRTDSNICKYLIKRNISFSFDIQNLVRILKCSTESDSLEITFSEKNEDFLIINFYSTKKLESNFEMNLMTLDEEVHDVGNMDYRCSIPLDSSEFKSIIGNIITFSETCNINVSEKSIMFSANGDHGKAHMKLETTNVCDTVIDIRFSVKYLSDFTKGSAISNDVTLNIDNELPLCVRYKNSTSELVYYLAPKMD